MLLLPNSTFQPHSSSTTNFVGEQYFEQDSSSKATTAMLVTLKNVLIFIEGYVCVHTLKAYLAIKLIKCL